MDIVTLATTLNAETSSYITYVINTEGLVSLTELFSYNYTSPLTSTELDTLFPLE